MTVESWHAVVQRGDGEHEQEEELVTLEGLTAEAGATIELTSGERIQLMSPVGKAA